MTSASGKRESRLEILSVMAVELKKSLQNEYGYIYYTNITSSVSDPDSIRSVDPDPDSEFGSRRANMPHKNREKLRIFMF